MSQKLLLIKGIGEKTLEKLQKQNINNIEEFREKVSSEKDRQQLAEEIGVDKKQLENWAKQADLMRIKGLNTEEINYLIDKGISTVNEFHKKDEQDLKNILTTFRREKDLSEQEISTSLIEGLKKQAEQLKKRPVFDWNLNGSKQNNDNNKTDKSDLLFPDNKFFFDMKDIIANIGEGIAKAQQAMDIHAFETQQEINENQDIANQGLTATWYTMPETTFSLKMNYTVQQEKKEEGDRQNRGRILCAPVNAKYQNLFNLSASTESELKIKFVPVPPPPAISQLVVVPDLTGLEISEAEDILRENYLLPGEKKVVSGEPANEKSTEVVTQYPEASRDVNINTKIDLSYKSRE